MKYFFWSDMESKVYNPKQIGIYRIDIGPYFYYGSSRRASSRRSVHLGRLQRNAHGNPKMQQVYNKYQTFKFAIVERASPDDLLSLEQQYLDRYVGQKHCMNMNPKADCGPMANVVSCQWNGVTYESLTSLKVATKVPSTKYHRASSLGIYSDRAWEDYLKSEHERRKAQRRKQGLKSREEKLADAKRRNDVKRGYSLEQVCKLAIYWNGRWWPSTYEAAAQSAFSAGSILRYKKAGCNSDKEAKVAKRLNYRNNTGLSKMTCPVHVFSSNESHYASSLKSVKNKLFINGHGKKSSIIKRLNDRGYTVQFITKEQYYEQAAATAV
jgi:hypothetical protein